MAYFRETSTMVSDLVLSVAAMYFGSYRMNVVRTTSWRYTSIGWFGLIGFSIIGLAAFLGFVRYGYFLPRKQHSIHGWHRYFSDMSSLLGMCFEIHFAVNVVFCNMLLSKFRVLKT